jgi:hypothetical protein
MNHAEGHKKGNVVISIDNADKTRKSAGISPLFQYRTYQIKNHQDILMSLTKQEIVFMIIGHIELL